MLSLHPAPVQLPLIHVVEPDDWFLEHQADVLWFHVLRHLDWQALLPLAAHYYEALWQFNEAQGRARATRDAPPNPESQAQATQRLLFTRATLADNVPRLLEPPCRTQPLLHVTPQRLRPGVTPWRQAGRSPKCFFSLYK